MNGTQDRSVLPTSCMLVSSDPEPCTHTDPSFRKAFFNSHFFLCIVGWITVALLVARWTNFFHTLFVSDRVNRPILYLAAVCLGINAVLLLYLTVYLPMIVKLTDSSAWEVYCPRVLPIMCVVGVLCAVFLIRATWPVWGFLAPFILGVEVMAALFALHFVPWF